MPKDPFEHGQLSLPLSEGETTPPDSSAVQVEESGDETPGLEAAEPTAIDLMIRHAEKIRDRTVELGGQLALSSTVDPEAESPDDIAIRSDGRSRSTPTRRLSSWRKNANYAKALREHRERTPGSRHRSDYG